MRVLITGGSGLVGRALTVSLAADGHEVIVLSRNPQRVVGLPSGARAVRWDGRTAEGWDALADGADAIVNLAGENIGAGRWSQRRKQVIRDSRLNAGRAVVAAVQQAEHKPRIVVQACAVGYYGPHGDEEITELGANGTDFLARLCAEWESSTAPVEALGVRRVIIRSGVVLSKDEGALPRMVLPFRLFIGGSLGRGRQWLPWIHLADEVAAIRFLIENETANGPFNLAAPHPLRNAELSRLLGQVLRRPSVVPTPVFLLRLLFGEMATVVLDGQRAVPQNLLKMGFAFRFSQAEAALRDLLG